MFRAWLSFEGVLETLTPLHVGTGSARIATRAGQQDGETQVSAIVRDHAGRPYIPGSSVKGVLRRQLGDREDRERLCGVVRGDGDGRLSPLTCYGAEMTGDAPDVSKLPFGQGASQSERATGVFVAARTRIDRRRGVADAHKLFHQDMVAPGACFRLRLRLELDCAQEERDRRLDLLTVAVNAFKRPDGAPMGKSTAHGLGRVRLQPESVKAVLYTLQKDGALAELDRSADFACAYEPKLERTAPPVRRAQVSLRCPGPFMIIDSSRQERGAENAQLQAQRIGPKRPLVTGASVAGALRARALWIDRLRALADGSPEPQDDPDKVLDARAGPGALSSVERLFGVTGWRGLVELTMGPVVAEAEKELTSVSVDRITGGARDGALFKTRCFVDVALPLAVTLRDRSGALTAADAKLFTALMRSIKDDGLRLGHGATKGFGWFETEAFEMTPEDRHGAG